MRVDPVPAVLRGSLLGYSTGESGRDQSTPEEFGNISVEILQRNNARICSEPTYSPRGKHGGGLITWIMIMIMIMLDFPSLLT